MWQTLNFILNHPLNKNKRSDALVRWLMWQVGSRLVPGPVAVPFINGTRLLVHPGMTGATGNIYCGLHEYESMAFVLHFLRPKDIFFDIGANVGTYSVLAASLGVECWSWEPVPSSFGHLKDNIRLNDFEALIYPRMEAISDRIETVLMTSVFDTTNKIIANGRSEAAIGSIQVPAITLDQAVAKEARPTLIKIDVEGHEEQVLQGGARAFLDNALLAVIMEVNTDHSHRRIMDLGLKPYQYFPETRNLVRLDSKNRVSPNTIYLRDQNSALDRLKTADPFCVLRRQI